MPLKYTVMRICRFDDNRVGIVSGESIRDVTAVLDGLPQVTYPLLAIRDMESAGIDIITDGEMRRESYSNRFATSLGGVDLRNPGTTINRSGARAAVPRIRGPIVRSRPIEVRDVQFLRANTERLIKITLPGPFTMRS